MCIVWVGVKVLLRWLVQHLREYCIWRVPCRKKKKNAAGAAPEVELCLHGIVYCVPLHHFSIHIKADVGDRPSCARQLARNNA